MTIPLHPTTRGYLATGEEVLVTGFRMPGGLRLWVVTIGFGAAREVRHDPATGETRCECGQQPTCAHRAAVVAASEGRLYPAPPVPATVACPACGRARVPAGMICEACRAEAAERRERSEGLLPRSGTVAA